MASISESKILDTAKNARQEMITHNAHQISRIYPDGWRQDSSNFDPAVAWSMGCHMICMNYQTWDAPMRLNFAKFRANGGCGYVLKPDWQRRAEAAATTGTSEAPLPPNGSPP